MKVPGNILFLLLMLSFFAEGQTIRMKMYGIEDGLSDKVVRNIAQDKFRNIWIGTEYGLNRYDGHQFHTYLHDPQNASSISNNSVFGLATDQQGYIWVGTDYGLNLYDPYSDEFSHFLQGPDSATLSNNHVRTVFIDSENAVWIGTEDGLNRFDRKTGSFKRYDDDRTFEDDFGRKNLSYNRINYITQSPDGSLWIALDGGGVKVLKDGQFSNIRIPAAKGDYLLNIVRTIYQSGDGIFWFGTDGGLVRYNAETRHFEIYRPSNESGALGYRYVWSIVEEGDQLWLGSYGGGLYTFNMATKRFTSHPQAAGRSTLLNDNYIWTLFRDLDDNIWMGMDGSGGLGFYDKNASKFDHFLSAEGKIDRWDINNLIVIDHDSILLDTSKGRYLFLNHSETLPLPIQGHGHQTGGLSLKLPGGYFFTTDSQFVITNRRFEVLKTIQSGVGATPQCITLGKDGNIWLGTLQNGLYKIDPKTGETVNYFSEGNSKLYTDSRSITALYSESDSILWVAGVRSGLFRFNVHTLEQQQFLYQKKAFGEVTIETIANGTDSLIWLGTYENGLLAFNTVTGKVIKNSTAILQSDQIKSILIDDSGLLWITSNKGLKTYDPVDRKLTSFGLEDGIQGLIFNKAMYCGASHLYFGGINGLNRINPEKVNTDTRTQPISIAEIRINDTPLTYNILGSPIHDIERLDLPYDHNDVTINFSANNYIHTDQISYQYRIEKDEWRDLGKQHVLMLSNLAPNAYRIAIRSINHDGIFSDPRLLMLNISPPWWNTWWAYLTGLGLLLLGIALVVSTRINRLKNQRLILEQQVYERTKELELSKRKIEQDKLLIEKSLEERETLLKEIHHRVKNNLQIIANLLYLQSNKSDSEKIKDILEEGQGRIRSMALIHQKLYENDDLKSIPFGEYIAELVHEIQASFGEEGARVTVEIEAKEIYFDVDNAVPLGLIINELTTNAFKYAFDGKPRGKFNIYITRSGGNYELRISDNGKGIPEEIDIRKTRSLGLRLVRVLSDQLEGEYAFENNGGMNFNLKFAA